METAITAKDVRKVYKIYRNQKERYLDFFLPKSYGRSFYALDDINFEIGKGESVGLIGLNGSGKSTLANLIAGYSAVSGGTLETKGNVSSIAVSAGVDIKLTGIENITQKCLLLGLSHSEIKELTPQIIEFADLGDFIYQQVKTYSSGMRSKLGFAISVNIDPDIMIIDEALSVGDPTFTARCLDKMNEFRKSGKTIIFVSHSMPQVRDFCDKAIWIQSGNIRKMGDCMEVTAEYASFIKEFNSHTEAEKRVMYEEIRQKQMRDL
ncbi:MAG: teichoic acids export ABC transporter ATP-binding subunit TagH [Oscillospiraceae bacterium]|nr:teichoic acids export ABC transporter ATP-binding subunit TagH [Oscillospiraceae bacterium]